MEECIICYNNVLKDDLRHKWSCFHKNYKCCKKCIPHLELCPLCRNNQIEIKRDIIKSFKNVRDVTKIYEKYFMNNPCIKNKHIVKIVKPYGILILCNTCGIINAYNLPS
jgi:hypothetical protein